MVTNPLRKSPTSDKPKRTITRVMIDPKKDDFYAHPYKVVEQVSLNKFDPDNNSNKFYIAELHESEVGKGYRFYINHGRVGANGQHRAEPFTSLTSADKKYQTKVREKLRSGYVKIDLATTSRGSQEAQKVVNPTAIKGVINPQKVKPSSLPTKVADLVKHLYDEANQAVALSLTGSVKTDIRAPIGNLGINGINAGRTLLSNIATAIRHGNQALVRQSSIEYYRNIPRKMPSDVRDESTWILNTQQRISKELDILDLYEDTLRMLPVMGVSDLDTKYKALNCDIVHITDHETLNYINHKVETTHAPNHNYRLKVKNVYAVNMKNAPQFNPQGVRSVHLFHGSRSANLVGILSSYLKLPHTITTDVVKSGAMFGPGIYFADNSTKSANYSFGSISGRANKYKSAFLMVAEVATGNVHKVTAPNNFRQPPQGFDSVMGCRGQHLVNNEFIVYNPNQVRVKYLVEVEKY